MNARINELLKQSIKSDGVINLFSDIKEEFSLFDPKFLQEVANMKEKKTEAEVIRRIFSVYIEGASLKEIADSLTAQQVPYTEKKTEWFKGRISRILENKRYCGDSEYDKIIDDEIFTEALDAKSARQVAVTSDLDCEINAVKNRVRCLKCGSIMTRNIRNPLR